MTEAPVQSKGKRRTLFKIGCGGLVLLLICIILAPRLIPTDWIRKLVISQVKEHTGRECSLGSISIGWLSGVSLENFKIAGNPGQKPMLEVKRLSLDVDLGALMDKNLVINEVLIDGAAINIVRQPGPGGSGKPIAVLGKRTRITDSVISYKDAAAGIDTTWKIRELTIIGKDINAPMNLQGKIQPQADQPLGHITISGTINMIRENKPDLNGTIDLQAEVRDLQLIKVMAGLGVATGSPVDAAIISGPLTFSMNRRQPKLTGSGIKIRGLRLRRKAPAASVVMPEALCDFSVDADAAMNRLNLTGISIACDKLGLKLSAEGNAGNLAKNPQASLKLKGSVDLALLAAFSTRENITRNLPGGTGGTVRLAGTITYGPAGLSAELELLPGELRYPLTVSTQASSAKPSGITLTMGGHLKITQTSRALTMNLAFKKAGARITPPGFTHPADVTELAGTISTAVKPATIVTRLDINSMHVAMPDNPWCKAAVFSAKGAFSLQQDAGGNQVITAKAGLQPDFSPAPLSLSATVAMPMKGRPVIQAELKGRQLDLAKLTRRLRFQPFSRDAYCQGKAFVMAECKTAGARLIFQAKLSADELWMYRPIPGCEEAGLGITEFNGKFSYNRETGALTVRSATLVSDPISANLAGTVSPAATSMGFNIAIRPAKATPFLLALGLPDRLLGRLQLQGVTTWKQETLTISKSRVSGRLLLDKPHDLDFGCDLVARFKSGEPYAIATPAIGIKITRSKQAALTVNLGRLKLAAPWTRPAGSMQTFIEGNTQTVIQILQRLSSTYPTLRKLSTSLAPYRIAARFSAPGLLKLQDGRMSVDFPDIRLLQAKFSAGNKVTVFRDPDTHGVFKADYNLLTGDLDISNSAITTSRPNPLAITYQGAFAAPRAKGKGVQQNWRITRENRFDLRIPALGKLQQVFPALFPPGFSLERGAAAGSMLLDGSLSALRLSTALTVKSGILRFSRTPGTPALSLPDSRMDVSAILNLVSQSAKPMPDNPYAYMRDLQVSSGKLRLNAMDYGSMRFADIGIDANLTRGVLIAPRISLNLGGRIFAACRLDFNHPQPLCGLSLRTDKQGLDLRILLGEVSQYGNIKSGTLYLPAPSQKDPLQLRWQGIDRQRALSTLASNSSSLLVTDCVIEINMDRKMLAGMTGIPLFMQLEGNVLAAMLKPFGAKLDRKTQKGVTRYSYKRIEGPVQILSDGAKVAGKRGAGRSLVYLPGMRVTGKDTADYEVKGYFIPATDYLYLRMHVVGHVERLVRADEFEKAFTRLGRLTGLKKLNREERARLRDTINNELRQLQNKRKLYFDIRGPLAGARMESDRLTNLIGKTVGRIAGRFLLDSARDRFLDRIIGDKNKGGDKKKDDKKSNRVDDLLKNLPF